jgi:hypothetical protein
MRLSKRLGTLAAGLTITVSQVSFAMAQSQCLSYVGQTFGNATIIEAEVIGQGTSLSRIYSSEAEVAVPACRLHGQIKPTADSDIRFEVWLPEKTAWNGRYQGIGSGGNGGHMAISALNHAINAGYAASANDTGHVGSSFDSSYAIGHPEKVLDFGFRSMHETAVAAKELIADYYGRPADLNLWNGCSTGGRQGMHLAQMFPEDYDGIAAGAPASHWPELNAFHEEFGRFLLEDPERWVSTAKSQMIHDKVAEACGAVDGFLEDPESCSFDFASLLCTAEETDTCLTEKQLEGWEKRMAPLTSASGEILYPAFNRGIEKYQGPNWFGSDGSNPWYSSFVYPFPEGFFSDYVHGDEDWTAKEFDLESDLRLANNGVIGIAVEAENPDMSTFADRGGKFIQYHGWMDGGTPATISTFYREALIAEMGQEKADEFYRLFMGPGVEHCGGGPGPDTIGQNGTPNQGDPEHDLMEALAAWIEEDRAPEQIIATKYDEDGEVVAQRPWCAYPKVATWNGTGDRSKAESYICE